MSVCELYWISVAVFPLLELVLTHWLINLASVTLHDSCHSPNWHICPCKGGEKGETDQLMLIMQIDTKRGDTRSPVSPPEESIKVKQLVFFPLIFFFCQGFNVTMVTVNDFASPDVIGS